MSMPDKLTALERITEKQAGEILDLKEKLRDAEEVLQHYRTAVSAVKWLWDQANQQPPFQL